ncbi:DUF5799 family protein [Natronorarus salvus]|uniref:DUF5799 family protein n=1 Tax=Natronorarus salvus TaxID=3117733 RepID=UPI002F26B7EE
MSRPQWMDRIVGERMATDREFAERVQNSGFSSQQWGLIMTAAEFEIEEPELPAKAELSADASKVPQIMPELDRIEKQMAAGGAIEGDDGSGGGGLLSSIKGALGLGGSDGDVDADRLAEAETLLDDYAAALQTRLEEGGRWVRICEMAAEETDQPPE